MSKATGKSNKMGTKEHPLGRNSEVVSTPRKNSVTGAVGTRASLGWLGNGRGGSDDCRDGPFRKFCLEGDGEDGGRGGVETRVGLVLMEDARLRACAEVGCRRLKVEEGPPGE